MTVLEKCDTRSTAGTDASAPRDGFAFASARSSPAVPKAPAATIDSVQYLRAIAAWLVVIYHLFASLDSEFGWQSGFAIGAIGVDIFFVISGYIMAMIASRGVTFSPVEFLLRRAARIAPLYWMLTIAFCLLCLVYPAAVNNPDISVSGMIFSLFFLPDLMTGNTLPTLLIGWTLNYEFFFYVIVAGSIWLSGDRTLLVAALMLCACVLLGVLVEGGAVLKFYTQPIILEFVMGILIWNYGACVTGRGWFKPFWLVGMMALIATLATGGTLNDDTRFMMWGMPAAFFVLGAVPLLTLRLPLLVRLGDWSFSTYLIHIYVIQLFVTFAAGRAMHSPLLLVLAGAVALLTILLASALQFSWFEKPLTLFLNRRIDRWWPKRV